jgi:hypothetical protein
MVWRPIAPFTCVASTWEIVCTFPNRASLHDYVGGDLRMERMECNMCMLALAEHVRKPRMDVGYALRNRHRDDRLDYKAYACRGRPSTTQPRPPDGQLLLPAWMGHFAARDRRRAHGCTRMHQPSRVWYSQASAAARLVTRTSATAHALARQHFYRWQSVSSAQARVA